MTNYLDENGIISDHQSGFRAGYSCATALLKMTEDTNASIANGKCVIFVLIDFSSAFPSVDHQKLLQVLYSIGVRDKELAWFEDFLQNWRQVVKFGDKYSNPLRIERGIIQGENNSQLLFSLFINNIVKYVKTCRVMLFADDVQLYIESKVNEGNDTIDKINEEMQRIQDFAELFVLTMNDDKTKSIIVSSEYNLHRLEYDKIKKIMVNGKEIEYVDSARNLGYEMNRTASGTAHTNKILQKTYTALSSMGPR